MKDLRLFFLAAVVSIVIGCAVSGKNVISGTGDLIDPHKVPTLDEVIMSQTDLWGDLAMKQKNGPSYEFFEKLLPPLRYVNAAFHEYPVVLSAPCNLQKARFVSNGSAVNASTLTSAAGVSTASTLAGAAVTAAAITSATFVSNM